MIRFPKMFAVAASVALAAACTEGGTAPNPPGPPPPPPGPPPPPPTAPVSSAQIALVTPNATDGAVLVTLSGPDVSTVQAADSHYVVYTRTADSGDTRVIVVGDLVAGPLFNIKLSAPHLLTAYSGTVQQVATRTDSLVGSLAGYQLTVSAP